MKKLLIALLIAGQFILPAIGMGDGFYYNPNVSNVTGILPFANGGTEATTAAGAASNLGVGTEDSPTFATAKLTNLTDGYVPYHVSDATGLANSPIYTDGTNVGFGTATPGATVELRQTTGNNKFLSFSSPDIAHGMTAAAPTDTYGYMFKNFNVSGGLSITGLTDADGSARAALGLQGFMGEAAATTGDSWAVEIWGGVKNGTGVADVAATGHLFGVRQGSSGTTVFGILGNGSVGIGTTTFGADLAKGIAMGIGTGATTSPADIAQIWVADFLGAAGDARVHVMGEGSANGRAILGSGTITAQGTTGGYTKQFSEATATLAGASTTIQTNVPSGARILGVQLRVDTLITSGDGAATWTAAFVNVPTTAICSGQAFAKNTKYSKVTADEIATGEVDIVITPNANTFSGGVVRAVIYYELYDAMANAA